MRHATNAAFIAALVGGEVIFHAKNSSMRWIQVPKSGKSSLIMNFPQLECTVSLMSNILHWIQQK